MAVGPARLGFPFGVGDADSWSGARRTGLEPRPEDACALVNRFRDRNRPHLLRVTRPPPKGPRSIVPSRAPEIGQYWTTLDGPGSSRQVRLRSPRKTEFPAFHPLRKGFVFASALPAGRPYPLQTRNSHFFFARKGPKMETEISLPRPGEGRGR